MKENKLIDLSMDFAINIIKLCKDYNILNEILLRNMK